MQKIGLGTNFLKKMLTLVFWNELLEAGKCAAWWLSTLIGTLKVRGWVKLGSSMVLSIDYTICTLVSKRPIFDSAFCMVE